MSSIRNTLRVNREIRIRQVRLIDESGQQVGIVDTVHALRLAEEAGLDLVEISPTARPPVCKIVDYGKMRYDESKRAKEARHKQRSVEVREVKMRVRIETHDYETKLRMAKRLMEDGSKLKAVIMFRGREITHPQLGRELLDRMARDLSEIAMIERAPFIEGRNMNMFLAPLRKQQPAHQPQSEPISA